MYGILTTRFFFNILFNIWEQTIFSFTQQIISGVEMYMGIWKQWLSFFFDVLVEGTNLVFLTYINQKPTFSVDIHVGDYPVPYSVKITFLKPWFTVPK